MSAAIAAVRLAGRPRRRSGPRRPPPPRPARRCPEAAGHRRTGAREGRIVVGRQEPGSAADRVGDHADPGAVPAVGGSHDDRVDVVAPRRRPGSSNTSIASSPCADEHRDEGRVTEHQDTLAAPRTAPPTASAEVTTGNTRNAQPVQRCVLRRRATAHGSCSHHDGVPVVEQPSHRPVGAGDQLVATPHHTVEVEDPGAHGRHPCTAPGRSRSGFRR